MYSSLLKEWEGVDYATLKEIARWLLEHLDGKKTLLFCGEMGSGKTTLIRTYLELLGFKDFQGSPTYNYYHLYGDLPPHGCGLFVHIDMHRIENNEEEFLKELEEFQLSGATLLVENYSLVKSHFFKNALIVRLEEETDETRKIEIRELNE